MDWNKIMNRIIELDNFIAENEYDLDYELYCEGLL